MERRRALGCSALVAVGLMVSASAECQSTWRRTYGGLGISEARSVRQTADGGYIVAGTTGSFGSGSSDIYVVRLNELGDPIWSRAYGGAGVDNGIGCRELPDGYIIAGTTSLGDNGSYDFVLIRTDNQGEPLWERNYGTEAWDLCNALEIMPDGFVLGGITYGAGMLNGGGYIVRTDLNGDTLWTTQLGGSERRECKGLARTADQGVVLTGSIGDDPGHEDGFLSKLDAVGDQEWFTSLGGDSTDYFVSVIELSNGDFVACGSSYSQMDLSQIYLASVDGTGQFLWEQFIGNTADAGGAEVRMQLDDGFVFTGFNTLNLGAKDMILTTTDANGYFMVGNNYGDGNPAEGFSIDPTMDGGFVVAGWAEGYGPGQRAMYVVKTDSVGQTQNLNVVPYSDPLPIEEAATTFHRMIYPNVVRSGEAIHFMGLFMRPTTVHISDMRGVSVALITLPPGPNASIQVPNLAPGLYVITIQPPGSTTMNAKFLVID